MKSVGYITLVVVLNALVLLLFDDFAHADQRKRGSADTHMSAKGQDNTNAQWFADPDRGWVRSDERRDSHLPRKDTVKDNKQRGKKTDERKVINY